MRVFALVAQALATILGAGGIAAVITAFSRKRQMRIDVASRLNEMSLDWASDIKKEADESRAQAAAMRAEMESLHRRMVQIQRDFDDLTRKFRILRDAIFLPNVSVEELRTLVSGYAAGNGNDN